MHPASHDMNNLSPDVPSSHNGMVSEIDIIECNGGLTKKNSPVVRESSLCIRLNGETVVTLLCSDSGREYLAIGFLAMEGFIQPDEMERVRITGVDAEGIEIEAPCCRDAQGNGMGTRTPGLGRGVTFSTGEERLASVKIPYSQGISPSRVSGLMEELSARSESHIHGLIQKLASQSSAGYGSQMGANTHSNGIYTDVREEDETVGYDATRRSGINGLLPRESGERVYDLSARVP